ncbi:MAG: phosphate uptake regulator PhoU, partial [Sulfolobaceae archaeon]
IRPIKPKEAVKEIKFTNIETVEYLITAYYMQGASRIIIRGERIIRPEDKLRLKNLQLELPGLEVEEEGFDSIIFRVNYSLDTDIKSSVSNFATRIGDLISDLKKAIESSDRAMAEDIKLRVDELMKRYRTIIRQIALIIQLNYFVLPFKDIVLFAIAMRDMGRIIHHIKTCAMILSKCEKISNEIVKEIEEIAELFRKSFKVFDVEDLSLIPEIRRKTKELYSINEKIIRNNHCSSEIAKELNRMLSYIIALMDDGVHKSVRI